MKDESVELLESKEMRESVIEQVEVLDKVGELLLLSSTEHATTEQVSIYYKVGIEAVKSIVYNHSDELVSDGYKKLSGREIKDFLVSCGLQFTNYRGYFKSCNQKFANRSNGLFSKRAILRVGMLLRDSLVAKEVRTRLLDITHDAEQGKIEIIQNVVEELSEEKQLILDRVEAEMSGDWDRVWEVNAKMFALKNKRIQELENLNEQITSHSLTIMESRDVINRIVRTIAMVKYKSMFGQAWGELYTKTNYKLGINVKSRDKKKNESYLSVLTENELFKVEEIVRNWAVECNLDLDKLLKIA